ncbi:MAG: 4Fe-4S double cluster binding domain-containing protein, partial [Oscillospiraceae bacterium]
CGACLKACPGGCISEKGIDKERCASFISQKKQELTKEQREILQRAKTVFGCDICQKVCPYNRYIKTEENLFSKDIVNCVRLDALDEQCKSRAFGFRGAGVVRRNLEIYEQGENTEI